MDQSKFNLWRACFSFCFVDGFLDPKEEQWIKDRMTTLPFSPDQKQTLMNDLKNPPDVEKLLPLITKPSDRGFLVNHMRLLSKIDSHLSSSEKVKIEAVNKAVLSKIDLVGLDKQIEADEKASYHEDEVYKVNNKSSFIEHLVKGLLKILNPGQYKYPDE